MINIVRKQIVFKTANLRNTLLNSLGLGNLMEGLVDWNSNAIIFHRMKLMVFHNNFPTITHEKNQQQWSSEFTNKDIFKK